MPLSHTNKPSFSCSASLCFCQKGSRAPSRCRGLRGTRTLKAPIGTVKAAPSSTTLHSTAVNSARCRATPELSSALYCPALPHPLPIFGYYKPHSSKICRICLEVFPCQSTYKPLLPAEEEPLSLSAHLSCSHPLLLCTLTLVSGG